MAGSTRSVESVEDTPRGYAVEEIEMGEEMQLEIAGGTGRRIRDDRGELPSVRIGYVRRWNC